MLRRSFLSAVAGLVAGALATIRPGRRDCKDCRQWFYEDIKPITPDGQIQSVCFRRGGTVTFIGKPEDFQWDFELEAVGKEPDGTIVLIRDLSYQPEHGWKI